MICIYIYVYIFVYIYVYILCIYIYTNILCIYIMYIYIYYVYIYYVYIYIMYITYIGDYHHPWTGNPILKQPDFFMEWCRIPGISYWVFQCYAVFWSKQNPSCTDNIHPNRHFDQMTIEALHFGLAIPAFQVKQMLVDLVNLRRAWCDMLQENGAVGWSWENLGGSILIGVPNSWMVDFMENPI